MATDQISAGNSGEPGFGLGSLLLRLLFALLIVLLTFNPSGFSSLHLDRADRRVGRFDHLACPGHIYAAACLDRPPSMRSMIERR